MALNEFGIIDYLLKKEVGKIQRCPLSVNYKPKGNMSRSLELKDFYGVFMILAGGVFYLKFLY